MSADSEWMRRVEEATAATAHEQLKVLLRGAQEELKRFWDSTAEQARLLVQAQAGLAKGQQALERTLSEASGKLTEDLDSSLNQLADLRDAARTIGSEQTALATRIAESRSEIEASLKALGDRLGRVELGLADVDERAARRLILLLASAFANLAVQAADRDPLEISLPR